MRRGYTVVGRMGLVALLLAGAAGLEGCRRESAPPAAVASGPVVATVAGVPIRQSEVAAQLRRTGGDPRRALEALTTFEMLAREAARVGYPAAADAGERDALKAAKVQRLVERELEPRLTADAIEEEAVRSVYLRARGRFVHGRLIEVGVLCLFTGARMRPEPRARIADTGRQLRAFVAARPAPSAADFEAIARDPTWAERKVSFTTVWQGDDHPFPPVVGRAVQALRKPGDMTDLVGDETGYYIAVYRAEKPAENVSLAEAAPLIRREMYQPWRRQRFLQLALALAEGHDIEVFPENFALLAGDGRSPEGPLPAPVGPTSPASLAR